MTKHVEHTFARWLPGVVAGFLFLSGAPLSAENRKTSSSEAGVVGLEEMFFAEIKVTSVSKKEESLAGAPAAITVITQEDIRRTGHQSLAEVLRLAPGVHVAQLDSGSWAISARGFNDRYNNKMLVLIDGRSVYTPLSGGVFWNQQDIMLEDVDRIEVIRGPGGSLWGANAVNGVINIVTKNAKNTQGFLVNGGGGSMERGFGSVRYGGRAGQDLSYRAYGKYNARADHDDAVGNNAQDAWTSSRGGFRVDWGGEGNSSLIIQGDGYNVDTNTLWRTVVLTPPYIGTRVGKSAVNGANVLARWSRKISEGSSVRVQTYYDNTHRSSDNMDTLRAFDETRDTGDLDVQHNLALGERNAFVWGAGFRLTRDQINNNFIVRFLPPKRTDRVYSLFAQDELSVLPDKLKVVLGAKYEHNDYTGNEVQPNGRVVWTPRQGHNVWGAVSRAVRTPARNEDSSLALQIVTPLPPPTSLGVVSIQGNNNLKAEVLVAYEAGYRFEPTKKTTLDITGFVNDYREMVDFISAGTPFVSASPSPAVVIVPVPFVNYQGGKLYGGEISGKWNVVSRWMLSGSYSLVREDLPEVSRYKKSYPRNIASVQSYVDITRWIEWNTAVYYADNVNKKTFTKPVPAYTRVDQGVTARPMANVELSVWGQNLLEPRHPEFDVTIWDQPSQTPRSVYAKASVKF